MRTMMLLIAVLAVFGTMSAQAETYAINDPTVVFTIPPEVVPPSMYSYLACDATDQKLAISAGAIIGVDYAASFSLDTVVIPNSPDGGVTGVWCGDGSITFSPDGNYVIFCTPDNWGDHSNLRGPLDLARASIERPGEVTISLIQPDEISAEYTDDGTYSFQGPSISGNDMVFAMVHWLTPDSPHSEGIYYVEVDSSGLPDKSTIKRLTAHDGSRVWWNPRLSPDYSSVLVVSPNQSANYKIGLATGIQAILNGETADPAFINEKVDGYYPNWCQDGQFVLYSLPVNHPYEDGTVMGDADFDVYVASKAEISSGQPGVQVSYLGNQYGVVATHGTKVIAYVEKLADNSWPITMATLEIAKIMPVEQVDNGKALVWVTSADFKLDDTAGIGLTIPAGTVLGNVEVTNQAKIGDKTVGEVVVTCSTPVSARSQLQQVVQVYAAGGVPLWTTFSPDGMTLAPPEGKNVTVEVHYLDAYVADVEDKSALGLIVVEAAKGAKSLAAAHVLTNDTTHNILVARITGFCDMALIALRDTDHDGVSDVREAELGTNPTNPDTDGDGLTDEWETRDFNPATPEIDNPFDPTVADSTGNDESAEPDGIPDGQNDWDGDGMSNALEFQFGLNPLDFGSAGPVPAVDLLGLTLLALLLFVVGIPILRSRTI